MAGLTTNSQNEFPQHRLCPQMIGFVGPQKLRKDLSVLISFDCMSSLIFKSNPREVVAACRVGPGRIIRADLQILVRGLDTADDDLLVPRIFARKSRPALVAARR